MTTENKTIFSQEELNKDIESANDLIEKSNEENFSDWEDLIGRLIKVSNHYIKYIQSTNNDEDEQSQIMQYKLTELTDFIMFAEKENFKANHENNLHKLELYFLMQYHLNENEFDLALALAYLTIQENYLCKELHDNPDEYEEDLVTIKEEFAEVYEQASPEVNDDLQAEIKKSPAEYYLSKI